MVTSPSAIFRDLIRSPRCFCRLRLSASSLADIGKTPNSVGLAGDGAGAANLVLQLDKAVNQGLGSRWTTWNIDIDGNDAIATANDSVGVVVIATAIGTGA